MAVNSRNGRNRRRNGHHQGAPKPSEARQFGEDQRPQKLTRQKAVSCSAGEWKPVFLAALRETPVIRLACEKAGVSRQAVYKWRSQDEAFAADWQEALNDGIDRLEEALHVRARGKDTLAAIFLLKNLRPEQYADKQRLEHTGAGGGPVQLTAIPWQLLTDAELEQFKKLKQKIENRVEPKRMTNGSGT